MLQKMKKYITITIGTFLYSAGISLLLDPNNLAPGGVSGISIILNKLTPVTTGTWILLINIPLLIIGWIRLGSKMMLGTVYATVLSSFFTNLLTLLPPLTDDILVAALLGSLCTGTGIGLVFRAGATTGGMDIVVKLLRRKYPYLKSGTIFLMLDMTVVITSGFLFRNLTIAVYAGMAVLLNSRVMDAILYGQDEARLIYVISDHPEEIAKRLLADAEVGVTYLEGEGAYSEHNKQIIMCVTRKQQSVRVVDIVKEEDSGAFLIISSASEVFGQGYKNIRADRL
ncbi:MAG: YitT family protein [Lachnospiraceae bacterium]